MYSLNKYFFNKVVLLLFLVSSMSVSCTKQLDIESTEAASSINMWQSYDDAKSALVGLYGLARAALANNNAHWLYGDLRMADFATPRSGSYIEAIIKNRLNEDLPGMEDLKDWRRFYAAIDACNTFIEKSGGCLQDTRYSALYHKVDVAQAHILRAFLYLYISRIWGDVPLVTSATTEGLNTNLTRTPQRQVLDFCINDVKFYLDSLPTEYGGNDQSKLKFSGPYYGKTWAQIGNFYWGYWQGMTVLAQIYAWMGDYERLEPVARKIWDNLAQARTQLVGYQNATNYLTGNNSIFYGNGVIGSYCYQLLSLSYNMDNKESGPSGVGHMESLTLANPYVPRQKPDIYVPRDTIDRLFYSITDLRHPYQSAASSYQSVYFTNYYASIPILSKFKTFAPAANGFSIYGSCIPLARAEDICLLLAECYLYNGTIGNAQGFLENIRLQRFTNGFANNLRPLGSGGPVYIPTDRSRENGLLWNIFRERRIELMGEGYGWYDLIRYKKYLANDDEFNKLVEQGGIYWPVSQRVLDNNPLIEQNSYWKR